MSEPRTRQLILLVEDNAGDEQLVREALAEAGTGTALRVARDGEEALGYLRGTGRHAGAERPDLVLLDLNMPLSTGHEVLAAIKSDKDLRTIPVVILTSSEAERDVLLAYNLHANCYVTKPGELEQFMELIARVEAFWLAD